MSRTVPWRSKPSSFMLEMIQAAKQYKLYLINEAGPFSFVFKDDHQNKFKVNIGSTLKCSCGVVQNDHCVHTIFVLLKRFKVDEKNPIIWQASYVDSQLEGLMSFKYATKSKSTVTANKKIFFSKPKQHDAEDSDISEIGQDENCPICYTDLKQQCFSTCNQCKNHLHTKCFKIWIKHKLEQGDKVTCPLCRNQFQNPVGIVAKDLQRWNRKFTIHKGSKCQGCGLKNIHGEIYHCMQCQHCNLCKNCFNMNQHNIHNFFLTKNMVKESWKIAKPRNLKASKKYLELEVETQNKQPTTFELIKFLTDSVMSVKDSQNLQMKSGLGLGVVGNQFKPKSNCKCCNQPGTQEIKKLNCGHQIHDYCLIEMLTNKSYYCPCGQPLIPGYLSALGIKPKRIQVEPAVEKASSTIKPPSVNIKKQTLNKQQFEDSLSKINSKPPLQKTKINHFRVRKNTVEKRPLTNTDMVLQINNMPIRARSLLRSDI